MTDDDLQSKLHNALKQVLELSSENASLRLENAALKRKIGALDQAEATPFAQYKQSCKNKLVVAQPRTLYETTSVISKAEKIALFRKLLRGREDVYPER